MDLGQQPPSDAFLRRDDVEKPEPTYPLALSFCGECGLVQLGCVVDPNLLFRDYVYTTGTNNSLRANFKALVERLAERFKISETSLVIDIGSNDGTLLENYAPHTRKALGVDPSSAALLAEKKGIKTIRDFFTEAVAERVLREYGKAKLITATNVFAHVQELNSFMLGIETLLQKDGVFVSESGYLLDMVHTLGYDAMYHEHLRYYSLRPLTVLFEKFGMEIFDVERIPSHNGSIRVYVAKKGAYPKAEAVGVLLNVEKREKLYDVQTFIAFAKRVNEHRESFSELLSGIRASGNRIVGIGAPAKGNTLLNSCGITPRIVEALLEKSELKIGLYAPGSHIPVVSEEKLFAEQPEYALLLSWNLTDELIHKLKAKGYRGKFILPFPTPVVVT